MNRRSGVTLTEVLIAIFIVALGLMSLLSLFPLGMLQMAQANKDERASQAAANAEAYFRAYFKSVWLYNQPAGLDAALFSGSAGSDAMDDPANVGPSGTGGATRFPVGVPVPPFPGSPLLTTPPLSASGTPPLWTNNVPPFLSPQSSGPSYPMVIDPIGWQCNFVSPQTNPSVPNTGTYGNTPSASALKMWWMGYPVGGEPANALAALNRYVPRRTLTVFESGSGGPLPPAANRPALKDIVRLTSLRDDYGFNADGVPDPSFGVGNLPNEARYKAAWFVRRPNNSVRYELDLSVIIYAARTLDVPTAEQVLQCNFDQGSTTATILLNGAPAPAFRRGQWVLDSTMVRYAPGGGGAVADPHGYFYRVVDVDDSQVAAGILLVELQTPARASTNTTVVAGQRQDTGGRVTILSTAAEVFAKGIVSPYTTPALLP
jgi:type II secretory pathway pseudopilin PulG